MIKYYCDLCKKEISSDKIRGIDLEYSTEDNLVFAPVMPKNYDKKNSDCEFHICTECLSKLGLAKQQTESGAINETN